MKIRFFFSLLVMVMVMLEVVRLLFYCIVVGVYAEPSLPFYVAKMVQIHFVRKVRNVYRTWLPNVYGKIHV